MNGVLCILLSTVITASSKGNIHPSHAGLYVGESVTLRCKSTVIPYWTKHYKPISKRHSILHYGLYLTNVTENDSGRYYCNGTDATHENFSEYVVVLVGSMFSSMVVKKCMTSF